MKLDIIVSGIRPTGRLHLGNYWGCVSSWLDLQNDYECYFFVADVHALTTTNKTNIFNDTMELFRDLLTLGIDPNKVILYKQSNIPQIFILHTLLSMCTYNGTLISNPVYKEYKNRLTLEKYKGQLITQDTDLTTYGFLGYPILQTADIAILNANIVPIGKDQMIHLEIARGIIGDFNSKYNTLLVEPKPLLNQTPHIIGLDGIRKMSKSYNNTILLDDFMNVDSKIKSMVTDISKIRKNDKGHPDICNVYSYHKLYNLQFNEIKESCSKGTLGCSDCKKCLCNILKPKLEQHYNLRSNFSDKLILDIIDMGGKKVQQKAQEQIDFIYSKIGFI